MVGQIFQTLLTHHIWQLNGLNYIRYSPKTNLSTLLSSSNLDPQSSLSPVDFDHPLLIRLVVAWHRLLFSRELLHPLPLRLLSPFLAHIKTSAMSNFLSMTEHQLPPGFRFHPRDEELVCDYLQPKLMAGSTSSYFPIIIIDVDLNKCEPWDLPGIYILIIIFLLQFWCHPPRQCNFLFLILQSRYFFTLHFFKDNFLPPRKPKIEFYVFKFMSIWRIIISACLQLF